MARGGAGGGLDLTVLISGPGVPPSYATPGAAGADLTAYLAETVTIDPGRRALIPTGVSLAIPEGFEGQIRPRSGLALRHGVLAALGTIDADYRGELKVLLFNLGEDPYEIHPGDRIAQIVIARVERTVFRPGPLPRTERGPGGFGHTGR